MANFTKYFGSVLPKECQFFDINSKDRQFGSNVQFQTKNVFNTNARAFVLRGVCFPWMCYSINSYYNKFIVGSNVYTITEANYTPQTLLTEINTIQSEVVLTYTSATNKYTFTSVSSKTIVFDYRNNDLAKFFGFNENSSNVVNTSLTSSYPLQFTYTRWIDICSDALSQDAGANLAMPINSVVRVPVQTVPYGSTYFYQDNFPRLLGNSIDRAVNSIDITILDDRGRVLNIPANSEFDILMDKYQ